MWHSSHVGEEDWDAEIAAIERGAMASSSPERPMDVSDDEGLGDEEVNQAPTDGAVQSAEACDNIANEEVEADKVKESHDENDNVVAAVDENNNLAVIADEGEVNLRDIELEDEICQSMDGEAFGDPMNLSMVKPLDLSNEEKEAMAKTDMANLNKIDKAVAYNEAVLKGLHPEVAPNELEVSVWEAQFKDEEEVQIVTDL